MKLVILFLAMLIANPALAVTCLNDYDNSCAQEPGHSTAGDCEDLGYSKTIEENCEHTIVCPFNSSYKRCVKLKELTCAEKGYNVPFTVEKLGGCSDLSSDSCKEGNFAYKRCNQVKSCLFLGFSSKNHIPGCKKEISCTDKFGTETTYYLCADVEEQVTDCSALGFTADDKSSWCDANSIKTCDNLTLCAKALASTTPETPTCKLRGQDNCGMGDYYYIVNGGQGKCADCLTNDEGARLIGVVVVPQKSGYSTPTEGLVVAFDDLHFQDGGITHSGGYLSDGSVRGWELDQTCDSISLNENGYLNTKNLAECDKSSDAETKISWKVWNMTNSGVFTAVEGFSNPDNRHWFIPSQKQLELLQGRVGLINPKLVNTKLSNYSMVASVLDFSGNAYRSSSKNFAYVGSGKCPYIPGGNLNYINKNINCRVRLMFTMPDL